MTRALWSRFTSHLYVRIWLAVVATIVVLTFAVGTAWQLTRSPPQLPIREILVESAAGEVIGNAQTRPGRQRGDELEFEVVTKAGETLSISLPRPKRPPGENAPWIRPPFGFGWMLAVVGLAVALGAYPIIRRLTLRLEALQSGVERWGGGDLSTRLQADGKDEVAFLARRFNHAAERIETLMDSHKSLLANASHELRSPLARIRMSLELLALEPDSPQRQEISRSIIELDQLIDEILLASRLDARQADAEPFELVDLTGLAAEECARLGAELNADLPGGLAPGAAQASTEPGPVEPQACGLNVAGSPRLLRRLIRNLLENARRYSTGAVDLSLSERRVGAQRLAVIQVDDRGPGVPPDQRERIFEPFYRLPGASERQGGVGLGLALVKSISLRHSGSVRCEARPGGGASFVVELPLAAR
ncbi:MAG: HAMP domain-containing protein [Polaromonas sp.]|nr:HAMP domain-containing protein [Polaromonas sp.]